MDRREQLFERAAQLQKEMGEVLQELRAVRQPRDGDEPPPLPLRRPPVIARPKAPAQPPLPQREFHTRDVLWRIGAAVLLFCVIEAAVFHSGFYSTYLSAKSTAGFLMVNIRLDQTRKHKSPHEALTAGDSRMPIWRRVSDRLEPETGYGLATITIPGTAPRVWYYLFRELDPRRNRFAAVILPLNDIEDDDWEDLAAMDVDMHYLVPLLRLTDVYDFARSFPTFRMQRQAVATVFLKGVAYNQDFQDLLQTYTPRLAELKWAREFLEETRYNYVAITKTVEGLQVDWAAHKITAYPPDFNPIERAGLDSVLLRPVGFHTGQRAAYRRLWFGRIIDYYRGTGTRVIFLRLPRGPVVRPYPHNTQTSVVREFAARGDAILLDENTFQELEKPQYFWDPVHLNNAGCERFTELLARAVGASLGPPRKAGS